MTFPLVKALVVVGTTLLAGTYGGVFSSTDNGEQWAEIDEGLIALQVTSLAADGEDLLAGTLGGGVWRRGLEEIVTSFDEAPMARPLSFSLAQNFPNPFNPTTSIAFTLPERSAVRLMVFDAAGREIATLLSGELPAGRHVRRWDARDRASGLYLYRLQAGARTVTRKMLILR
jgi:hypothetical protein